MTLSVDKRKEKQREIWRKASKKYKENNKDKIKDYKKKVGKKYFADAVRKYAHKNKNKIREKANKIYHKDNTKGKVRANTNHQNEKIGICFDCKKKGKTEFHHLSYEPNIFIELCRKCHNKRHGRNYYGR